MTRGNPAMLDAVVGIAEIEGPVIDINNADLVDWIEQHQTVRLSDDGYPHQ